MKFTHFFVDRPIFATVISVLIVLVGLVSYFRLPVAAYPDVVPPTIQITASYPGASAEVVSDTVATPLEQEINGVEGMLYMLSQATSDGRLTLTITFELGTDLDEAQVLVQNRVAIAEPRLPEAVRRLGVQTQQNSPNFLMVVHMISPDDSRDQLYISNYARTQIVDRLLRIDGVGQATVFGERAYSMRIWLDPDRVAARGLTAGEVVAALQENNVQVASGTINQLPTPDPGAFQLNVETQGRLVEPDQFENIVIGADSSGRKIRVRDVARVELGAQDYTTNGYLDDKTALPIGVFQRPGSNALETAEQIKHLMEDLEGSFPPGVAYDIVYNPTEFIEQSVEAVYVTIEEAVLLVVLVVVVFLQSLRASIIPILAIPVSLIGTFFVMQAFGFSLNNLSLFGLVLAIGIVVDDAIVVVENVERYIEEGMSPREATHKTMDEVAGALVSISLVLCAVFIPAAFIEGITGQFFRQFAVTIAAATVISVIVSLTLSPALSAVLLKSQADKEKEPKGIGKVVHKLMWPFRKFADGFNWAFDKLARGYAKLMKLFLSATVIVLAVYAGLMVLAFYQFNRAPAGFIPEQDQGYLIAVVQLPPGASLSRTDAVIQKATDLLLEMDSVEHTVAFAGLDGATFTQAPNAGAIFMVTTPFEERLAKGQTNQAIIGEAFGQLGQITEANAFVIAPPPIQGIGNSGGWKLYLQDERGRGLNALEETLGEVVANANQTEGLTNVFTLFNTSTPKIYADIDRVKSEELGVPPERVFETLQVYLGSAFVNDFNFIGRTYRVTAQADGEFRDDPQDVLDLRTRSTNGGMVPIGSVAELEQITGPYRVPRYNLFPAAAVQGATTPGLSTGEAIAEMEAMLDETLPDGFGYEWTELALQEKLAGNTAIFAFAMAVVFVYLMLAAQYESWFMPFSVILIVPMCLLAGISGVLFRGIDNNILVQIGFVVLVGLASKNAILIVEFAKQAEENGMSRVDAAIEAARLRLRPILMTSFAFILGVIPLVIAEGPGAEMRQALGTAVFSGMLGVTFFGLLFTPVFYVAFQWLANLFGMDPTKKKPEPWTG
ncbi:efflux RND transporter permease subunit [Litoreibacter roseus]|uniref:Efflux pump membrane transporter n=1 Tax=Litoreibacter roseus TaxID=2601869 RepID=A0A6N6JE09_9RHOB|nr:multidrug efflux RND transporter permease subunit [Litoreibacter roseus]GFE64207.1 multidrug efflux RND transporter permease subunit [Litoreibacter roseus]